MDNNKVIGITLGDAAGIGPELLIKALNDDIVRNMAIWIIVGDKRVLEQGQSISGMKLDLKEIDGIDQAKKERGNIYFIDLHNLDTSEYEIGEISEKVGKATGDTLRHVLNLAKNRQIDGIVYGPLNKESLQRGGYNFKDELHFYADFFECKSGFGEINVMDDLWVTRVTSHIPMKDVYKELTEDKVLERINFAYKNMKLAGYTNPRIYVAAYNPHCGEGGLTGTEELEAIVPAIAKAQEQGINVHGPFAADTIFVRREKDHFDCVLSMYHDQAQIGMKILGFSRGITISAGLPAILMTPAHGTAYDIAGKGIANDGATIAAMKLAVQMANNS